MNIVLLGAPGAGKGTQATRISDKFGLPHISTGDIFRDNIKRGTEIGLLAKSYTDKGQLVPDEVTCAIVKDRLTWEDVAKSNGYLLDGFPRSIAQAKALDGFQQVDYAVNLDVDKEVVVKRLSGRRFCPDCSGTYHVSALSDETVCPHCGGKLIIRADDAEETVRERQRVYESTTLPLLEYYDKQGKLLTVDGNGTVEEVYDRILAALK